MSAIERVIEWMRRTGEQALADEAAQQLAAKDAAIAGAREALTEAVEIIRLWHNMDTGDLLTPAEHAVTWLLYTKNSPEMKRIFAALAALDAKGQN